MSENSQQTTYRCHSSSNDVAALLLTDPTINDTLRSVMDA